MKDLYNLVGITKQGLWKYHKRQEQKVLVVKECISLMNHTRMSHKQMGSRSMFYASTTPPPVGRDLFEDIGLANGFRVKRRRNKIKTTWGQRIKVYPDLVQGLEISGINQVWQSDIFYQMQDGKVFYGVTIIDVYSRELLALHLSTTLRASENLCALKKAIKARKGYNLKNCIFHSDRGTQYISDAHTAMLLRFKMKISMCKMPQQNAFAERIQGTIKNQYLCDLKLQQSNLAGIAQRVTNLYNNEKPHQNLNMRTPGAFKNYVENLPKSGKPKMVIFKWEYELSTKSDLLTKRKR